MKFVIENQIRDQAETTPRPDLQSLQLQRLRDLVARTANVPFYKDAYARLKVSPESIKSLDDIRRLPFTTKADLREHYPLGFLAVPRAQVARIHGSSGTTASPPSSPTPNKTSNSGPTSAPASSSPAASDPNTPSTSASATACSPADSGCTTASNASARPSSPPPPATPPASSCSSATWARRSSSAPPSYALHLAEVCRHEGADPHDLPLRFGHFGGEPWTEEMRGAMEREFSLFAFNNYGLSEVMWPRHQRRMRRAQWHAHPGRPLHRRVPQPRHARSVKEGEPGELVFTSLTKQAFPLIRYRTRDIAALDPSPCPCGRTTTRMGRVIGRSDDMMIIRGVNVFPSQIEEALLRVEGTAPHYLIEIDRPGTLDDVIVRVEIRPQTFSDKMSALQQLHDRIDQAIHAITGIRMKIELVAPNTLERSMGKAVRVIDHRKDKGKL